METQIAGKIKLIRNEQIISEKFKKREFVITTQSEYPQDIIMEFVQDKCDVLNAYSPGENVNVSVNIRGREWINPQGEARYFNTLQAWRIEKIGSNVPGIELNGEAAQAHHDENAYPSVDDEDDDLPF